MNDLVMNQKRFEKLSSEERNTIAKAWSKLIREEYYELAFLELNPDTDDKEGAADNYAYDNLPNWMKGDL